MPGKGRFRVVFCFVLVVWLDSCLLSSAQFGLAQASVI